MSRKTASIKGDRVIIVGAGPGGLAAAILLAGAGLKVTVLERLERVGGRTSTLEGDGFRFDLGPHLLPLSRESSRRSSPPSATTCAGRSSWSASTRSTTWSSAAAASCWRRRGSTSWTARSPPCRPQDAAPSAVSWTTTATRSNASAPASSRRSSAGRTSRAPASCSCSPAPPLALARPGARRLLQRPAHPARLLVPVEVPGDVAVQAARACSRSSRSWSTSTASSTRSAAAAR